ncbi:unnamed protein product [Bathycoccus prasinos]
MELRVQSYGAKFYSIGLGGSSHEINLKGVWEAVDQDNLKVMSLPELMDKLNHTKIDILKVDIEGSEFDALDTALDGCELDIDLILIEVHIVGTEALSKVFQLITSFKECEYRMYHKEPNYQGCHDTVCFSLERIGGLRPNGIYTCALPTNCHVLLYGDFEDLYDDFLNRCESVELREIQPKSIKRIKNIEPGSMLAIRFHDKESPQFHVIRDIVEQLRTSCSSLSFNLISIEIHWDFVSKKEEQVAESVNYIHELFVFELLLRSASSLESRARGRSKKSPMLIKNKEKGREMIGFVEYGELRTTISKQPKTGKFKLNNKYCGLECWLKILVLNTPSQSSAKRRRSEIMPCWQLQTYCILSESAISSF